MVLNDILKFNSTNRRRGISSPFAGIEKLFDEIFGWRHDF
jgi:hypothetical protein